MTGNDENGGGMNQSIIESATREHVYTGFVDPRKCSTQKELFLQKHMIHLENLKIQLSPSISTVWVTRDGISKENSLDVVEISFKFHLTRRRL